MDSNIRTNGSAFDHQGGDSPSPPSPDDRTRLLLALAVAIAVIALALVAVVQPTAEPVLDKLLPLLTLVLGYFFGQQA